MLAEKELRKIVRELSHENLVKVDFEGVEVLINRFDLISGKAALSACVYFGGNFIPQSVRQSVIQKVLIKGDHINTSLSLNEEEFTVLLNYVGTCSLEEIALNHLLEEFCWIANEWRLFLDEQDRNDLVYVRVR